MAAAEVSLSKEVAVGVSLSKEEVVVSRNSDDDDKVVVKSEELTPPSGRDVVVVEVDPSPLVEEEV